MKKSQQQKKFKKNKFPLGIFLMLFIIQSLLGSGGVVYYYYSSGISKIEGIEKYGKSFAITLADAFAEVAELSYRSRNYGKLKSLFTKKIDENIINEAFFVLKNGTLIVHSNKKIEKTLKGNIANDEFSYNIEMILWPLKKKTREVIFTPYNVIGKIFPFNIQEKKLIKQYLYKDINTLGWLVTRGVYNKNKPVGTVNFLIYNDKIFEFIISHIESAKIMLIYCLLGTFFLSLLISLIVLARYRSIQKKIISLTLHENHEEIQLINKKNKAVSYAQRNKNVSDIIIIDLDESMKDDSLQLTQKARTEITEEPSILYKKSKIHYMPNTQDEQTILASGKEIKDAIPIIRKG